MKPRDKYYELVRSYYADPENPPATRTDLAKAIKVNRKTIYKYLTLTEFARAEHEGLAIRRERLAATSVDIDRALMVKACEGDVPAMKLFYQRLEGWSERSIVSIEPTTDELRDLAISLGHDPDEYVEAYNKLRRGDRVK